MEINWREWNLKWKGCWIWHFKTWQSTCQFKSHHLVLFLDETYLVRQVLFTCKTLLLIFFSKFAICIYLVYIDPTCVKYIELTWTHLPAGSCLSYPYYPTLPISSILHLLSWVSPGIIGASLKLFTFAGLLVFRKNFPRWQYNLCATRTAVAKDYSVGRCLLMPLYGTLIIPLGCTTHLLCRLLFLHCPEVHFKSVILILKQLAFCRKSHMHWLFMPHLFW